MKSSLPSESADATIPPTSTRAPRPKMTPFGLIRNTCPLADNCPKICEGSAPSTRLSATACAEGCAKVTFALEPILNVFQLATMRSLPWVTRMLLADCAMLPAPATMLPLVGSALGSRARAGGTANVNGNANSKTRPNEEAGTFGAHISAMILLRRFGSTAGTFWRSRATSRRRFRRPCIDSGVLSEDPNSPMPS